MNSMIFNDVINPLTLSAFLEDYWEKKPFHFRNQPSSFEKLLSLEDVDKIVMTMNHKPFSVVKNNYVVPADTFKDGEKKNVVVDLFNQGATLILDNLERTWNPLATLCRSCISQIPILKNAIANVYLSPPSSQAFEIHSDWQDGFIIQVSGSKSWDVYYPSYEFPTNSDQTRCSSDAPDNQEKLFTAVLHPGDVLYIPRGYRHEVKTVNEMSLHITLSLIPCTWGDIFKKLQDLSCNENLALRESLPIDFFTSKTGLKKRTVELVKGFENSEHLNAAIRSLQQESLQKINSNYFGYFSDVGAIKNITPDTIFGLRNSISSALVKSSSVFTVESGIGKFEIDGVNEEMSYIFSVGEFAVEDIPGDLEFGDKVELISTLVREGLLEIRKKR